jgi:hypothetical protein
MIQLWLLARARGTATGRTCQKRKKLPCGPSQKTETRMSDPHAPQGPQFQGPQQQLQSPPPGYGQQPHHGYPQQPPTKQESRARALADKAHRKAMRPWYKKKRFILPLVLVALILLSQAFKGGGDTPTTAAPAASTSAEAPAASKAPASKAPASKAPAAPAAAKIGEKVEAGDWTFKVTKFECGINKVGDQYVGKKAQGQFCKLNLNATNNGDSEGTVDENNLKLLADGKEFSSDSEASLYEDSDSMLFLEGVNPGNTAKGLVIFDVPKKLKPTQVSLAGGFFGTKSATVDLE